MSRCLPILLVSIAMLAGCASTAVDTNPPLPFHVAIVPVRAIVRPTTDGGAGKHDGLELDIDPTEVRDDLAIVLEQHCFTRITKLSPPAGVADEEFQHWSEARQEQYWTESAKAAGADLILHCEMRATPDLKAKTNSRCWFNMPLFLLGGPACYFVDDCSFLGDARLDAWLSDIPQSRPRGNLAPLVRVQTRFTGADLDFLDRAGSRVLPYFVSVLIPATWLARDGDAVEKRVGEKAAESLANGVAHEVRSEWRRILVAESLSSFHVDSSSMLARDGEELHFHGSILLLRGEAERIDHWRLETDEGYVDGDCGPGVPDASLSVGSERWVRFTIDARIHASHAVRFSRLIVVSAGRNPVVRSFTFSVDEGLSTRRVVRLGE